MQPYPYDVLDWAPGTRFRGTNQQTDTDLHWMTPLMTAANTRTEGLAIGGLSLHNRSAATVVVGLGVRIPNRLWVAGQWDDAGGAVQFTDDTTDAQDTGTNDFVLETTTNDDGFAVASRVLFNAITFNVTTASVDATNPARAVRYSNTAGTGWTNLSNLFVHDGAAAEYDAGENLVVFGNPLDWGQTTGLAEIPNGYYAINVRATTAPDTTAGLAGTIELWRIYGLTEGITDNSSYELFLGGAEIVNNHGTAVQPLFGTLNQQNRATVFVRAL